MTATRIGYARCSTDKQDLTAQRQALKALGVSEDRIYTDHGLTGTNRARPGLDQALAAVRDGDVLIVPKLDRLARSVPDARTIAEQLEKKGVKLALGASVYDPTDPMGKMFFNILATFAEFEADLIRMRTREGMAIARAKGKLRGKQPKLSEKQQKELMRMHGSGDYSISDLAELFSVSRPTVYRTLQRAGPNVSP
ncbi:MAG: recombinase family protein [Paracoccaceae bacterium]|nr:recombinase family protein [Paracoccaceae bacterium]